MKNHKTKIKFTDIAGMLDRDEMKEIVGGSGGYQVGTGGGSNFVSGTALGGGFTTGYQAHSSFNGAGYSYSSSGSSSYGSSNFGSGSGGSMSSFTETANGYTTSNPSDISAMYAMLYGSSSNNGVNSNFSQIQQYAQGQSANNLQLYGTVLDNVNVNNAYQAPSSVYVNPFSQYNSFDPYSNTNSIFGSSGGGEISSNNYVLGSSPTDCVFQSMAYLANLYGNSNLNINSMQNNYNSLYSGAISAGIIAPASGGVDGYLLSGFVDQYFNRASGVTTIAQLNSFIAAAGDNFAIGTYGTGVGDGHAIVITGVTPTQYIGWDAQNNKPVSIDKNLITGFVAITGRCP